MSRVAIIGCGFVADLYMRSLASHPEVTACAAYDRDHARLAAFCAHWGVAPAADLAGLLVTLGTDGVVLNLTNPGAHYEVNRACLEAGHHVYSEKPLAMEVAQAQELFDLAATRGLMLASAPCSVLGEAAQVLAAAVRRDVAGTPRLVYAELDDGFIPQAPYGKWQSESGAPWPYEDEFRVGCTLEHAGYYLSWLIAMFGRVETVVAASASVIPDKPGAGATPDFSVATLFFADGPVARLTCSIAAPHDHRIRVIGDKGVLQVARAWDNAAPVRFFRRLTIRRRLLEHPFGRRIRARGATHPKPGRWGAASMNFALGPVEMLAALAEGRACRLSNDMALHLTEVTLAIQNAGRTTGPQVMQSGCERMELLPWA
ncbi:putative oxidoreductase [Roseovarius gaetbuli]|uniref:Putative oxidoreductase n=1 Tax=Roseovarius gaetbuli TaxID=1356575 RepID=A0A1X6Z784_9RHOB|nr:Gfo/Idh/MocA family oxidoreductase [Roseovarius gaetbuli]SLN42847.1 putative oxidoreductase [Roseovarius gaetbuli]